jgi:hypothetical protein
VLGVKAPSLAAEGSVAASRRIFDVGDCMREMYGEILPPPPPSDEDATDAASRTRSMSPLAAAAVA